MTKNPYNYKNLRVHSIHLRFTESERELIASAMDIDGWRQPAVFSRKLLLEACQQVIDGYWEQVKMEEVEQ